MNIEEMSRLEQYNDIFYLYTHFFCVLVLLRKCDYIFNIFFFIVTPHRTINNNIPNPYKLIKTQSILNAADICKEYVMS